MNLQQRKIDETSEQAEFDAIRDSMRYALQIAISEEDARQKILDGLPKNRDFLGPLIIFSEFYRAAMVGTINEEGKHVDIKAEFTPE